MNNLFILLLFIYLFTRQIQAEILQKEDECLKKCGQFEKALPAYRVMGGGPLLEATQPAVVRVQIEIVCQGKRVSSYGCTGFIIGEKYVLTAQHCLWTDAHKKNTECAIQQAFQPEDWQRLSPTSVRVYPNLYSWPAPDGHVYHNVQTISMGQGFEPNLMNINLMLSDYALLTVDKPFDFASGYVRSICLPLPHSFSDTLAYEPDPFYDLAGWGTYYDRRGNIKSTQDRLTETTAQVQQQRYCERISSAFGFTRNHICGGRLGHGGMKGDSGSPMQVMKNGRYFAVGLLTNAAISARNRQMYPDTYIQTETMCDFLQRETKKQLCIHYRLPRDIACEQLLEQRRARYMDPAKNVLAVAYDRLTMAEDLANKTKAVDPPTTADLETNDELERFCTYSGPTRCPKNFVCVDFKCALRCNYGDDTCPVGYHCHGHFRCVRDGEEFRSRLN